MFTIIEDCSPYYIRFTYDGIEKVVDICNEALDNDTFPREKFLRLSVERADAILEVSPIQQLVPLKRGRAVMLRTPPGGSQRAHKDGVATKCSFNYSIRILDDKSTTNWYTDEDLAIYKILSPDPHVPSREVIGFDKDKHKPICTLHARPNECMLINVDIFHAWDNSQSDNERVMLTLRAINQEDFTFEQARLTLFGY